MHSSYLAAILRHRQQTDEAESGHWRVGKWNRRQDSMGTLPRVRPLFEEGSWQIWEKTWGSSMKIVHHSRIAPEENRRRRALMEERDEDHNDGQQANEHDDLSRERREQVWLRRVKEDKIENEERVTRQKWLVELFVVFTHLIERTKSRKIVRKPMENFCFATEGGKIINGTTR